MSFDVGCGLRSIDTPGHVENTTLLVLVLTVYQEWVLNIVVCLSKTLCDSIT